MAVEGDGDDHRERPEDLDISRLRADWAAHLRRVRRLYTELDRAIREAESAERAYNLAVRAAKIQRTDLGGLVLALVGVKFGDPPV